MSPTGRICLPKLTIIALRSTLAGQLFVGEQNLITKLAMLAAAVAFGALPLTVTPAQANYTSCLSVDWSNETFGGAWYNGCSYKVYVVWRDDNNCRTTCAGSVGPHSRASAGIRGTVRWCEADELIVSSDCDW